MGIVSPGPQFALFERDFARCGPVWVSTCRSASIHNEQCLAGEPYSSLAQFGPLIYPSLHLSLACYQSPRSYMTKPDTYHQVFAPRRPFWESTRSSHRLISSPRPTKSMPWLEHRGCKHCAKATLTSTFHSSLSSTASAVGGIENYSETIHLVPPPSDPFSGPVHPAPAWLATF